MSFWAAWTRSLAGEGATEGCCAGAHPTVRSAATTMKKQRIVTGSGEAGQGANPTGPEQVLVDGAGSARTHGAAWFTGINVASVTPALGECDVRERFLIRDIVGVDTIAYAVIR